MGTNTAPDFANLAMAFYEQHIFSATNAKYKDQLLLYKRFIDDIFYIFYGTDEEALAFQQFLQDMCPFIDLTFESSLESCNFLDITVYKGRQFNRHNRLATRIFRKFPKFNGYPYPSDFQPENYQYGWIKGEHIRLIRTCSDKAIFDKEVSSFMTKLRYRHYPPHIVENMVSHHQHSERKQLLYDYTEPVDADIRVLIHNTMFFREMKDAILKTHYLLNPDDPRSFSVAVYRGQKLIDVCNSISKQCLRPDADTNWRWLLKQSKKTLP
jgi:hypothetical protein